MDNFTCTFTPEELSAVIVALTLTNSLAAISAMSAIGRNNPQIASIIGCKLVEMSNN